MAPWSARRRLSWFFGTSMSAPIDLDAQRTTILVVDDDDDIRAILVEVFRREGWRVDEASDGREALARVDARRTTLALVDQCMPEMTGTELLEEFRRRGLRVPVILMSALWDRPTFAGASAATSFLAKPFRIEGLLTEVRRALARERAVSARP